MAEPPIGDDIPRTEVTSPTDDQLAMLDLFDVKRVRQTVPVSFLITPDAEEEASGMSTHVARHHCPVVTWRGRERIVMPDGALETLSRRAAND